MNTNFNYLKFFNEPNIDHSLWESGFFCGDFVENNGSLSKILTDLGYQISDMLEGRYLQNIHPADISTYKTMINRLHNGLDDILHCEYRLKGKNNTWNWILTQAFVIKRNKDNSVHKIIGIDRDINSRKNVESYYHDELIDSKLQLDLLNSIRKFDNSPGHIEKILEKLKHVVEYDNCEIFILKGKSLTKFYQYPHNSKSKQRNQTAIFSTVKNGSDPVIINDPQLCAPYFSLLVIPLQINKNNIGCVTLRNSTKGFYKGKDLIPVRSFSDFLALFINNTINKREEVELAEKIYKNEHLYIARELHDGISQNLACGKIITEQLTDPRYKNTVGSDELIKLHNIIKNTLKEVRILTEGIRITSETRSLNNLIERYCSKLNNYFTINITFKNSCEKTFQVPPKISENILRIIQEGISNSQRHSSGKKVIISLTCDNKQVSIQIKDNGSMPESFTEGLGMKGVRERTKILNGTVNWKSDNGTIMTLTLDETLFDGDIYEHITD